MHQAKSTLQETIAHQRKELIAILREPLLQLAARCLQVCRAKLDLVLSEGLKTLPYGKSLYALNTRGIE